VRSNSAVACFCSYSSLALLLLLFVLYNLVIFISCSRSKILMFTKRLLIVIGHGFQKKTQKTPGKEIERAEKIKTEYYEEK